MQDTTQKGNIDLDELVSTLVRERADSSAVNLDETVPYKAPSGRGVSPADVFAAMLAEEEGASDNETEESNPLLLTEPLIDEIEPKIVEVVADNEEETVDEPPAKVKKEKKKREKKSLFARRASKSNDADTEDWEEWGLKPIGHYKVSGEADQPAQNEPVQEQEPIEEPKSEAAEVTEPALDSLEIEEADTADKSSMYYSQALPILDEFPSVQPVDETITMTIPQPLGATQVVSIPSEVTATSVHTQDPAENEAEEPVAEQLPDQISMEEMVRVEDMEEPPEGVDEDPNQRLQRTRLEKIRDFTINGEEEEENEPEEESEPEEVDDDPEIEDFNSFEDVKAVQHELRYRCRTAALSMLFTGLLEAVLLLLTIITAVVGESPITAMGYLTVQVFGLILMLVLNYSVVSHGLSGLFRMTANGDSGPAFASVVALLGVIPYFTDAGQSLPVWAPVAGLLLLFSSCSQYLLARRVMRNFAFVSYPSPKYAANIVEDEQVLHEIGRRAAMEGDATIGYFRRTAFLSDYLANAYEPDNSDDWARWLIPVSLLLSLGLSAALTAMGYLVGFWGWLQAFVGMLCLSMPALSMAVQLPLNTCCRRMMARGGFMVGWKAVRRFGCPDGLAVDVADLYPDESMLLHGIKTFSGTHIDDAILDAASLSIRAGGPLSLIFRRIIENKDSLLHEVDSLVYEQGMGVSGWVDGRRVLVGNRRLLENHGVDVPSSDYEARYAKDGRRLVYLSTAGELSAMFVISYLPDDAIKQALQRLCRSKMMLLIRSCDQNITAESLCEDFELSEYYVDVLPAVAGRLYTELTEGESESSPAELASNGHILGTAQAISACRNLHTRAVIALLTHTVLAAVGLILAVVWAVESSVLLFLGTFGVALGSAILAWILPLFKRL